MQKQRWPGLAASDVDQKANLLKGKKRNPERQDHVNNHEIRPKGRINVRQSEGHVFEHGQNGEVKDDRASEPVTGTAASPDDRPEDHEPRKVIEAEGAH